MSMSMQKGGVGVLLVITTLKQTLSNHAQTALLDLSLVTVSVFFEIKTEWWDHALVRLLDDRFSTLLQLFYFQPQYSNIIICNQSIVFDPFISLYQKRRYIRPGGNHADSRAFSAYSPRILRAFSARALCAENARRIRGEYAENARRIRVSATRTFRVFSAHSPRT